MSVPNYYQSLSEPDDDDGKSVESTKSHQSDHSASSTSWKVRKIPVLDIHPVGESFIVYAALSCCRSRSCVTTADGTKKWVVCTKKMKNCRRHDQSRLANRVPVGYFICAEMKEPTSCPPGLLHLGCALTCHDVHKGFHSEDEQSEPEAPKKDNEEDSNSLLSSSKGLKVVKEFFKDADEQKKFANVGVISETGKRYLVSSYEDAKMWYQESTIEPIQFHDHDHATYWLMTGSRQKLPQNRPQKGPLMDNPDYKRSLTDPNLSGSEEERMDRLRPHKAQTPSNHPPLRKMAPPKTRKSGSLSDGATRKERRTNRIFDNTADINTNVQPSNERNKNFEIRRPSRTLKNNVRTETKKGKGIVLSFSEDSDDPSFNTGDMEETSISTPSFEQEHPKKAWEKARRKLEGILEQGSTKKAQRKPQQNLKQVRGKFEEA